VGGGLELVGVDADVAPVEGVAALHGDDERRSGTSLALWLELLAKGVHEVAHIAQALASATGP
jgi:hypothetical protein